MGDGHREESWNLGNVAFALLGKYPEGQEGGHCSPLLSGTGGASSNCVLRGEGEGRRQAGNASKPLCLFWTALSWSEAQHRCCSLPPGLSFTFPSSPQHTRTHIHSWPPLHIQDAPRPHFPHYLEHLDVKQEASGAGQSRPL